jgi:hypothetical protein
MVWVRISELRIEAAARSFEFAMLPVTKATLARKLRGI